jgi:chaperonin GroEL
MAFKVDFEPLQKMMVGLNIACDAAGATLGPKGRNVYLDDPLVPKITNDGHTIVSHIELPDKLENMGLKIAKSSCARTVDEAGDGTTTTAVLLQAIMKECMKRPENPMVIRKSLLDALPKILAQIKKSSKKIDKKDIKKVALISSEDEVLASAISEILNKLGQDATVKIEDALDNTTSYTTTDGYEAGVGYLDSRFSNQQDKAKCVMKNVPIVVCEKKIAAISDLKHILELFQAANITECVFVVEDIDNAILGQFLVWKMTGQLSCCVIRAQGDVLKDIEAAVGATRVSDSTGISFQKFSLNHLGRCKEIEVTDNKSLFIPDDVKKSRTYVGVLKQRATEERNQYVKEKLLRRAQQMQGSVAVLKIGSPDFNREYLKDKADDAIKACKAALEEGIVEGGGMCLYRIAEAIKPKSIGEEILKKALSSPLRKIIENAGQDYAEIVKSMPQGQGYDAKKDCYADMISSGIIDPSKVERVSIINAVSNSANLITSHASISEYTPPKKD